MRPSKKQGNTANPTLNNKLWIGQFKPCDENPSRACRDTPLYIYRYIKPDNTANSMLLQEFL